MNYKPNEMMTIAAARALKNTDVTFVGIGMPSAAANLARTSDAVERATGVRPTCYRPPSMLTNAGVRAAGASVGLTEVTANGANGDWTAIGPERMVANAIATYTF